MTIPWILFAWFRSLFYDVPPSPTVGLGSYRHEIGACHTRAYGHHSKPKFCGDPRCANGPFTPEKYT